MFRLCLEVTQRAGGINFRRKINNKYVGVIGDYWEKLRLREDFILICSKFGFRRILRLVLKILMQLIKFCWEYFRVLLEKIGIGWI